METVNNVFPDLKDVQIACQIITLASDLTPIITDEQSKEFRSLAYTWITNFRKHKDEVIREIISELSNCECKNFTKKDKMFVCKDCGKKFNKLSVEILDAHKSK